MVRPVDNPPVPPQRTYPDIDPSTIAPINEKGNPDMYNYLPSRLVTIEEALVRGWKQYYIAEPCRYGHVAPRYVSNRQLCIDCDRIARGKQTIGGVAAGPSEKLLAKQAREEAYKALKGQIKKPAELERVEQSFLVWYAKYRNVEDACKACNWPIPQMEARRATSRPFRESCELLEERLDIRDSAPKGDFEWTQVKRARLVEQYVDSGDLSTARDSIGVSPSEYFREIKRNPDFANMVEEAKPLADQALEERAIQLALKGNPDLLKKVLSAKKPEYRDKIDLNVTEKLSDAQINARLTAFLNRLRPSIIEGQFESLSNSREIAVIGDSEGTGETEESTVD